MSTIKLKMSHGGRENQGTGLRDVFDVLVKAPRERLLSLTFQLGESPEDNIVHALCLILLQKEERALNKLQMLKINLANHIVEKWQTSGGKLEDFAVNCGHFQEFTREYLALLARVFKVLSEQKLCDPPLRDLAYQRALSRNDNEKTSEDLEYDQLREEAVVVCGPQFAEMMCSSKDLKSGSYCDPLSSLDSGTLKVSLSQDQTGSSHSLPSPLQATSSMPSYPTHLEISIPPTALFQDDRITPETSGESELNAPVLVGECEKAPEQSCTSQPKSSLMIGANKHSKMNETLAAESSKSDSVIAHNETLNQTTKPSIEPNFAQPAATNIVPPMQESKEEEEEEEEKFYPFVIFHAPEDAEMAESMRERLQRVIGIEGATFSEDFAIPGRSPLRCVEDAINNSAFTFLLFTRNFNTRMEEMETDSALINSINNTHKYNTVIPLLPRENRMPKQDLPLVLKTLLPLEENRSFERNIRKSMTPAMIKKQEKIWIAEQAVKKEKKRQERLKNSNKQQKELIKERTAARSLEIENMALLMAQKLLRLPSEQGGGDSRVQGQQQPNIHIENAQYIMIGNDSQMTVGFGGGPDKDGSIEREEEQ